MPDELLCFPSDVRLRRLFQSDGARLHPGKIDLAFLGFLLTRHTSPGQLILDPMAGSGSCLLACCPPWNCDVMLNELEPHWCQEIQATWERMQTAPRWTERPVGAMALLQGDAKDLSQRLLRECDAVVFSPPYSQTLCDRHGVDHHPERMPRLGITGAVLQHGYDAIVTSPPYSDALDPGNVGRGLADYLAQDQRVGDSSMMHAPIYDAVVTSPPFADALAPQRHSDDYHPEILGHNEKTAASNVAIRRGYDPDARYRRQANPAQIGNLSGKRYAAAMTEVYRECHALLKDGGLMILVIKNVVRNNTEVDLVSGAISICQGLGFEHVTTHWRQLPRIGAFHAIRRKANPDALIVMQEAGIVMRKS